MSKVLNKPSDYTCTKTSCKATNVATTQQYIAMQLALNQLAGQLEFKPLIPDGILGPKTLNAATVLMKHVSGLTHWAFALHKGAANAFLNASDPLQFLAQTAPGVLSIAKAISPVITPNVPPSVGTKAPAHTPNKATATDLIVDTLPHTVAPVTSTSTKWYLLGGGAALIGALVLGLLSKS